MNSHFKIIIRDNFINNDENNYRDLHDLATNLYKLLCSKHCKISLSNLCIVKYYFDVPHINFYVSLTDGLIIYNDETYIRISHLYPEFCAMDNIIINNTNITNNTNIKMVKNKTQNPLEHFPKNQQSMNSTTNFIMSHANTLKEKTNIEPENRQKNISKNKIPKQFQNHIQKNNTFENKLEIISETLNPLKSLQNSIQKQIPKQTQESSQNPHNEENYSLKIRQFRGDKLTFKYMKKDIDSGVLKPENINPMFSLKYMIFKILDSRSAIDFNSDQNIQQEYVLFNELFKECVDNNEDNKNNMDNEEDSDESDIESDSDLDDSKSQNIEIPYKYFYLPVEEKESIAKKYGLNVSEFEDKYINKSNNKIQSINQENSNTIFSESVKSDSNESESIKSDSNESESIKSDSNESESIKSESIKSDNSNNHKNFGNTDFENNLLSLENYHTF